MKNAFLVLVVLFLAGCAATRYPTGMEGVAVSGVLIDGDAGEPLIGMTVWEYDNKENAQLSDLDGKFTLTFEKDIGVIVLHDCFAPIHLPVDTSLEVNTLIYGLKAFRQSRRLQKRLSRKN